MRNGAYKAPVINAPHVALMAMASLFTSNKFAPQNRLRMPRERPAGHDHGYSDVGRRRVPKCWSATQSRVHKLTNWQRQQWAHAGYPQSTKRIDEFLAMEHRA